MADNVVAEAIVSSGVTFVAASFSFSGDSAFAPGGFSGILSGSEGSWTFTLLAGGAGAVSAGVQRMTLASDDPAVAKLGTIDTDTGNIATSIASLDGKVTACNTGAVVVSSSALPSGAATAANQATISNTLSTINSKITACDTGSVAIASSALPTGAATSSKQDTIIASLSSIDGHVDGVEGSLTSIDAKITAVNTGAVVIASSALPTGAATAARQDTGNASLSSIDGKLPALGQALAAASVPVVLTAIQVAALTPPAAITGFATESTLSTLNGKVTACNTGAVVLAAGTAAFGKLAANAGVTIGAVEIASSQTLATVTTVGTVTTITNVVHVDDNSGSLTVDIPAVTTGGATPGKLTSAASTNATSVKGSAGTLYMLVAMNTNAAARYLKLYNKASAPTVGSDTPVLTFTIPGNTAGAGFVCPIPAQGIAFSTGIAFALTTGAADADTGAVALSEINVNYAYK